MKLNHIFFCTLICLNLLAQGAKPKWVKWMNENRNYFKACEKYDKYWEHHYKPQGRDKGESQVDDPRRWIVKIFQSQEKAHISSNELKLDYKHFKKWRFEVQPYVKSNGDIMSAEERIEAWQQTRNHK